MRFKNLILKIVNIFWPILEGEPIIYKNFIKTEDIPENSSTKEVDYAYKMYLNQNDRIKTIESKSMIFIGIFGSLIVLLSFIAKDLFMSNQQTLFTFLAIVAVSILVVYSTQVLYYSIKALTRKAYYSFSYDDFLSKNNKETILSIITKIQKNYDSINNKVDNMTLAQDFMKRLIFVIFLCAIIFIFYGVYMIFSQYINITFIIDFIKKYLIYLIVFILLFYNVFLSIKIKKLFSKLERIEKEINKDNN